MSKAKDYLKRIFEKNEPQQIVRCTDLYGNEVFIPENQTVLIYNARSILNNIVGLYADFEKYLEYNKNKIKTVDASAFVYHEDLYPLAYHLAIMDYCQSSLIVDDEAKKKIDLVAYEVMLQENKKVEKLGIKAIRKMGKTLQQLDRIPVYSKESFEFVEEAKVGLMFQLGTLSQDLTTNYEIKKIVDERDPLLIDERRVDFMKLVISQIAKKDFLTTPYQEEFEKQKR